MRLSVHLQVMCVLDKFILMINWIVYSKEVNFYFS